MREYTELETETLAGRRIVVALIKAGSKDIQASYKDANHWGYIIRQYVGDFIANENFDNYKYRLVQDYGDDTKLSETSLNYRIYEGIGGYNPETTTYATDLPFEDKSKCNTEALDIQEEIASISKNANVCKDSAANLALHSVASALSKIAALFEENKHLSPKSHLIASGCVQL